MPKPTANTVDTTTIENHIKLIAAILDRQRKENVAHRPLYTNAQNIAPWIISVLASTAHACL